eukprot:5859741-Pyramimonas_sp.AAC.1
MACCVGPIYLHEHVPLFLMYCAMPKPFVTMPPSWTRDQVAAYIYAAYEVLPKMVRGGASQTAAKKSLEYILKVWQPPR